MIVSRKSPSNKDRQITENQPENKQDLLARRSLPPPKEPQRLNHLPDAKIPQHGREKNHSEMDGDETFQNKREGCFGPDIANGISPDPQVRVMEISLHRVIPGQCRNHRNESNHDTASCCQNTSQRVAAWNEPAISEARQYCAQGHS